jgi:pimeloyl-ACP methyl ester carboxylesterase
MADPIMTRQTDVIDGRTVCVHTSPGPNPASPTLFLLHGGWGSAVMHWSPVWEDLAAHARVIAPELPGMGYDSAPITSTIPEFSRWLIRLMDYLEIGQAWVAGNSMGGALVWHLALIAPDRVKGMILINGGPLPPLSKNVQLFARTRLGRLLVRAVAKRVAFSPQAVESAFADRSRIPKPLLDLCRQRRSSPLRVTTDMIVNGTISTAVPSQPCLIIWGTEDRLHGNPPDQARRLQHRLHDARLVEIPDAGHMPQIEQPRLVIDALAAFVGF